MKKIEGDEKQVCTELYKRIYEVLSDEMPDDVRDNTMEKQKSKEEAVDLSNVSDEQKIKKEVERFAMTHDDMRLPADWLKYIPCRWECYYRYKINDGTEIANVFLYHDEKKRG